MLVLLTLTHTLIPLPFAHSWSATTTRVAGEQPGGVGAATDGAGAGAGAGIGAARARSINGKCKTVINGAINKHKECANDNQ